MIIKSLQIPSVQKSLLLYSKEEPSQNNTIPRDASKTTENKTIGCVIITDCMITYFIT